jgi:N-methylhydantoinase A
MRYEGQSFELEIQADVPDIAASFHHAHRARYGYAQEAVPLEIVSLRLRSRGLVDQRKQKRLQGRARVVSAKAQGVAYFGGRRVRVGIYQREQLGAGMRLRTPCIVTEYSATTLIPEGVRTTVDGLGNLILEVGD